jgi:hypothetical protein
MKQLSFYSQVPSVVPRLKPSSVLTFETNIHAFTEPDLFTLLPSMKKKSQWKVILLKRVSREQCSNK